MSDSVNVESEIKENSTEKINEQLEKAMITFVDKVPDYHEIIISINGKEFVLDSLSSYEKGIIIFEGHDKSDESLPIQAVTTSQSLHFLLSTRKRSKAGSKQKRVQIGFRYIPSR